MTGIKSITSAIVLFSVTLAAPAADSGGIVAEGAAFEELWNEGSFTEGVAVDGEGDIYFSDISMDDSPGKIYRLDAESDEISVYCADSGKSNGLMFARDGRLIAACGANYGRQALCEVTADGKLKPLAERFEGKRFNAPNDLAIHPSGTIYFSDPRYLGPEPVEIDHMSVYRYDPADGSVVRVTTDISKPNGVIFSPDARTLYVAETDNRTYDVSQPAPDDAQVRMTLNAFPVREDGSLGDKRVLVDFGQKLGIDGMTVDTEGRIYAAVRSADRFGIVVFDSDGRELAYLPTPELPTNCCFGRGQQASTLYITAGTGLYRIGLRVTGHHSATAD